MSSWRHASSKPSSRCARFRWNRSLSSPVSREPPTSLGHPSDSFFPTTRTPPSSSTALRRSQVGSAQDYARGATFSARAMKSRSEYETLRTAFCRDANATLYYPARPHTTFEDAVRIARRLLGGAPPVRVILTTCEPRAAFSTPASRRRGRLGRVRVANLEQI